MLFPLPVCSFTCGNQRAEKSPSRKRRTCKLQNLPRVSRMVALSMFIVCLFFMSTHHTLQKFYNSKYWANSLGFL